MTMQPSVEGDVDEYSVSPPVPQGVDLNSKTGVISGSPTEVFDSSTFEVSARNETGVSSTPLKFGVKVMPPESLTYLGLDHVYYVGEPRVLVTLKVNTGGRTPNSLPRVLGKKQTRTVARVFCVGGRFSAFTRGRLILKSVSARCSSRLLKVRLLVVIRPSSSV